MFVCEYGSIVLCISDRYRLWGVNDHLPADGCLDELTVLFDHLRMDTSARLLDHIGTGAVLAALA